VAGAATAPPLPPFTASTWKATAESKLSTGIKLGTFAVRWEETPLASVLTHIGFGRIQHQGDAAENVYWLCYTIEGVNAQRLWIMAHGEMGGPEHLVTNITAEALKGAKAGPDCPALPKNMQPSALGRGVWLGWKDKDALKVLGAPSHTEGAWRSFDHQSKVPGRCEGGSDLTNWLLYKTQQGQIVS